MIKGWPQKNASSDLLASSHIRLIATREKELLDRLQKETGEKIVLEKELADLRQKLSDPKDTEEKYKKTLNEASAKLKDFKKEFGGPRVTTAQKRLAKGETEDAEKLFAEALEQGTEQAGESAYELGSLAEQKIEYEKAFNYYNRSVEFEKENPRYLKQAGIMALKMGKYGVAESLLLKSLKAQEKATPHANQNLAADINNLAELYKNQGKYAEAEALLSRPLAARKKAFAPKPSALAASLDNRAPLDKNQARHAEVNPLLISTFTADKIKLAQEFPAEVTDLNNRAALYRNQGRYADAEPLYKRAVAIMEKALPDHPELAAMINNYAFCLRGLNRISEAQELAARAKVIKERREKTIQTGHP